MSSDTLSCVEGAEASRMKEDTASCFYPLRHRRPRPKGFSLRSAASGTKSRGKIASAGKPITLEAKVDFLVEAFAAMNRDEAPRPSTKGERGEQDNLIVSKAAIR